MRAMGRVSPRPPEAGRGGASRRSRRRDVARAGLGATPTGSPTWAGPEAYRAGAAADPKSAECWLGLATVGIVRGDAALALSSYDEVLARRPRFAPGELGRAWALARLGRTAEAERAIDRAEDLGAPAENVARQRASLRGAR